MFGLAPILTPLRHWALGVITAPVRHTLALEQHFDPCGRHLPKQVLRLRWLEAFRE